MDGCTLCPSFGFEGEVAVSCSHHKSPGMRNLTARRCQHEGCFTVANFGMPGDKPGYCAAHSTTGMVNRNKPRGAEGMLAGVPIARSSRRAAKANTVLQGLRLAGHTRGAASGGAAADSATTRASFNRTHYSTSLGSEPSSGSGLASAGTEDGDDCEGYRLAAAPARMLSTSWTSNGLPHESYREESDEGDPYSDGNSRGTTDGGKVKGNSARVRMTSITGAPQSGSGSGSGVSFMPFISRGEDPPESDIGPRSSVNGNQRRVDVPKGVGAGRVRARGGSAAAAAATQEAYLAVHRVGLKAAQMGQAVDNIMLGESVLRDGTSRTGIAAGFPGHARGGQGGDASKDIESLRAYLIDSTDMDSSLDGSLGMGINSGMELLGNDGSLVPGKMSGAGHDMVATSRGMDLASALRRSQAMRCRSGSASGLSMGASACRGSGTNVQPGGAIGCQHDGGVLSDDDDGEDFGGLVNLQGLSPLGLAGLNTSAMTEGPTRAAACTPVSDSAYAAVSMGLATPGVSSSRAASAALSSSLRVGFVSTLASSGTPTSSVFAVCHNSASTSPQHAPASVSAPLPAAVVLQGDDGWWDVLEGEEFVAMPEPLWGVGPTSQGLDDEPAARGQEDPRSWRGGGAAGSFPMSTRGNGGATLPDPLDGGDSNLCSEKDGKDSLQAILLDQTDRLKPRTLLSSSPSIIGDGVDVSDEGFVTIEDSKAKANRGTGGAVGPPGFPMLSGGSRLANGRDDLGDIGGVRLRPRYPNGGEDCCTIQLITVYMLRFCCRCCCGSILL